MDEHVGTMDEFIGPLVKEAVDNKNKSKSKRGRGEEMENGMEEGGETLLGHLVNSTDGTLTPLSRSAHLIVQCWTVLILLLV